MSELQIALIAAGILLIAVVAGLNWWQDRRVRRKMQEHFPTSREDPLLSGEAAAAAEAAAAQAAAKVAASTPVAPVPVAERREPAWGDGSSVDVPPPPPPVKVAEPMVTEQADDVPEPDLACEAVIDVVFPTPVPGQSLFGEVREIKRTGNKPLRVWFDTSSGVQHTTVRTRETYGSVHIAVLLANRSGPLTATEWAQAWARAQQLADAFDGEIEGPDPKQVLNHAVQLDAACAALDTSVGLTLVARGAPWAHAAMMAAAEEAGFAPAIDDRLPWVDRNGAVRFTLARSDGGPLVAGPAARLTLLLDVPRSPAHDQAFADMAGVARSLARRLDADLVDDNGQPLASGSIAAVDKHLSGLYARLTESDLPAGSPRALRVFA